MNELFTGKLSVRQYAVLFLNEVDIMLRLDPQPHQVTVFALQRADEVADVLGHWPEPILVEHQNWLYARLP